MTVSTDEIPRERRRSLTEFFESEEGRRRDIFRKQWPAIRQCYRENAQVNIPRNPRKCASEGKLVLIHDVVSGFPDEGSAETLLEKSSPYILNCQKVAAKRYMQKRFKDSFDQKHYESLGGHKADTCFGSRHPCEMHRLQLQLQDLELEAEGRRSRDSLTNFIMDEYGLPRNRKEPKHKSVSSALELSTCKREHLEECNITRTASGGLVNKLGCTCSAIKAQKLKEVNGQLDDFVASLFHSIGDSNPFRRGSTKRILNKSHLSRSTRRLTAQAAIDTTLNSRDVWGTNNDACWHQVTKHYFTQDEVLIE